MVHFSPLGSQRAGLAEERCSEDLEEPLSKRSKWARDQGSLEFRMQRAFARIDFEKWGAPPV